MHNIGITARETSQEFENPLGNEFQNEFQEFNETMESYEFEGSNEFQEFSNEFESYEFENEMNEVNSESPLNETMEMELAAELLEVQTEQEMERFLGKLMGKASGAAGNFVRSSAGKNLGGVLKKIAGKALPWAARIAGGMIGGPIGAKIGGGLGNFAAKAFGLELEGLSGEDKEFALSRAFVRFGANAARRAAYNRHWRSQPRNVVRYALYGAARRYAPGLLYRGGPYPPYYSGYTIYDDRFEPYAPSAY
jgi:uncharacterized protein (DUF697 family)